MQLSQAALWEKIVHFNFVTKLMRIHNLTYYVLELAKSLTLIFDLQNCSALTYINNLMYYGACKHLKITRIAA